jgi:hypothetical protein
MNVLYILGNGFDKAQGMKTSYPEFYQYLIANTDNGSDLLQQLKKDIDANKELWSDMEEAFGLFTSNVKTVADLENLYFELSDNLQDYLKEEEKSFAPSDQLRKKFQNDFLSPGQFLGATDRGRYIEFANRMTKGMDISVMSFNYTNTLERLLSLGKESDKNYGNGYYMRQIIHVHGILDSSIIIGVDNEEQILNKKLSNNEDVKDLLVKEQSNLAMKFTRHLICEKLISEAQLIILYGVSMGKTDARWWKMIGEQFKKRNDLCVIRFLYVPDAISSTRRQLLGRIERESRIDFMMKLGFQNESDWPQDTLKRLFFITNSEAFKLKT